MKIWPKVKRSTVRMTSTAVVGFIPAPELTPLTSIVGSDGTRNVSIQLEAAAANLVTMRFQSKLLSWSFEAEIHQHLEDYSLRFNYGNGSRPIEFTLQVSLSTFPLPPPPLPISPRQLPHKGKNWQRGRKRWRAREREREVEEKQRRTPSPISALFSWFCRYLILLHVAITRPTSFCSDFLTRNLHSPTSFSLNFSSPGICCVAPIGQFADSEKVEVDVMSVAPSMSSSLDQLAEEIAPWATLMSHVVHVRSFLI